eukprot:jgi/Psemu1/188827/e_gw1.81.17.1
MNAPNTSPSRCAATVTARPEWILVTGQPGCGKTTAVKKMVEFLQGRGRNCRGFYTDEVLDPKTKSRIGFDVVSVPDGKRGILSRKAGHGVVSNRYKTGQYFVDVASFEAIAIPSLQARTYDEILVLDEIGRMELHSTAFSDLVRALLSKEENNRLVGAITSPIYGHRVPFCDEVAEREGVEVHKLTKKTRDQVLRGLLELIPGKGWC